MFEGINMQSTDSDKNHGKIKRIMGSMNTYIDKLI